MADSRVVRVELAGRGYPIRIGKDLLLSPSAWPDLSMRRVRVLTDQNVAPHYLQQTLNRLGLPPTDALTLPAGEPTKNWQQVGEILDWMLAHRMGRDGVLVALGGGVIGDLAGFCASIFQRGIDFIQIPTTLLAQVDSSVGGKTGVNHRTGKNLIGSFHQPIAVIADTNTLATLPQRERAAGLAEVIKYGMLADPLMFEWLESNLDRLLTLDANTLAEAIERCCGIKARIVGNDERENLNGGQRALLNLGHTFGHAIEAFTEYEQYLHGEAVAIGLCMAADLSARHGWIDRATVSRCVNLIERAGLPTLPPENLSAAQFRAHMAQDKKVKAGGLRLVLLHRLGEAILSDDFDDQLLETTLNDYGRAVA